MKPNIHVHLDNQTTPRQEMECLCDFYVYNAARAVLEVEGEAPVGIDLTDPSKWYARFDLKGRKQRTVTVKAWGAHGEYEEASTTYRMWDGPSHLYPGLYVEPVVAETEYLVATFQVYSSGRHVVL